MSSKKNIFEIISENALVTLKDIIIFSDEKHHVDFNEQDINGNAALSYAIVNNKEDAAAMLINLANDKLDFNIKNNDGFSPLQLCVLHGQNKIFRLLIEVPQVDVNVKFSENGNSIGHYLVLNNNMLLLSQILQNQNFDFNARNDNGDTIYSLALNKEYFDIFRKIISYEDKIDINMKNILGHSITVILLNYISSANNKIKGIETLEDLLNKYYNKIDFGVKDMHNFNILETAEHIDVKVYNLIKQALNRKLSEEGSGSKQYELLKEDQNIEIITDADSGNDGHGFWWS